MACSPKYAYRLLFCKKLVNRAGQADRVIEFLDPNSDLGKTIDKEFWVKKEIERPKFRPTDVVKAVQATGFKKFRVQPEHVDMWKSDKAKRSGQRLRRRSRGGLVLVSVLDRPLHRAVLQTAAGNEYK